MNKILVLSLLSVLLLTSCKSNPPSQEAIPLKLSYQNIEGVWIDSHYETIVSEGNTEKQASEIRHIIEIKENAIRLKMFQNKGLSIPERNNTFSFTLKDDKMYIDDSDNTIWEFLVYQDSMIVTHENTKMTYKKLPVSSKRVSWTPKGKLYTYKIDDEICYTDYSDANSMLLFFSDATNITKYDWKIDHIHSYSFLLLDSNFQNLPLLIDSITGNKIYLTDYALEGRKYVLEEITKKQKKPKELLGTWTLANLEDVQEIYVDEDGDETINPLSRNRIKEIIIEKDSIFIMNHMFKQKSAWNYYEEEKLIVLKDKEKLIKIRELGTHSLLLEMNLEMAHFENKQFIFIRE